MAVTSAQVKVYQSAGNSRSIRAQRITSFWTETEVNWANQPIVTSTGSDTVSTSAGNWVTLNVTGDFTTGTYEYSWRLSQSSSLTTASIINTRENTSNRPYLIITYAPGYVLTTNVSPAGGGTVTGAAAYVPGATAQVKATAGTGYAFTGWSGDLTGNANPAAIVMNGNKTVTANFTPTTTTVVYAVKDTYIDSTNSATNYGTQQYMRVGYYYYKDLVAFSLTSLPVNAVITGANLRFYNILGSNTGVKVLRITSTWDENTATWNNQPEYHNYYSTSFNSGATGWTDAAVTADVQLFYSFPSVNYGWVLYSTDVTNTTFSTRESDSDPQLEITYYVP